MVTKSILPLYSASIFTRSGNSSRHGTHHVAQKLTSRGLPFGLSSALIFASSICMIFGKFAGVCFVSAGGFETGFFACAKEFAAKETAQKITKNTARYSISEKVK